MTSSSPAVFRLLAVTSIVFVAATALGCALWSDRNGDDEYLHAAHQAKQAEQLDIARLRAEAALEEGRHTARAEEILAAVSRTRADEAFDEGLYRRAHQSYLEAADYEPAAIRRAADLRRAFEAAGHFGLADDEMLQLAERILEYHPEDTDLRREAARLAEDLTDYETAVDHYRWLLATDETDTGVALRLGISYLAVDRPGEAMSLLQRAYQRDRDNIQIAINLADAYRQLDYDDHALDLYDDLVERFPDHPAVLRRAARLHRQLGDDDRARRLQQQAAEASPGVDDREMRPLQ